VSLPERELLRSIGWSKDGNQIVYDSREQIFIYDLATGLSTPLVSGSAPTWSPDGHWIAYRQPEGAAALISSDRGQAREVLNGIHVARGLRWSPDSRYLLFTNAGTGEISVLDLQDGRTERVILPIDGRDESGLRWVRGFPYSVGPWPRQ
jgi:Tol biopolymer transport system component